MKLLPEGSRGRSSHLITLIPQTRNGSFPRAAPQSWSVWAFFSFVALAFHIPQQWFECWSFPGSSLEQNILQKAGGAPQLGCYLETQLISFYSWLQGWLGWPSALPAYCPHFLKKEYFILSYKVLWNLQLCGFFWYWVLEERVGNKKKYIFFSLIAFSNRVFQLMHVHIYIST